MPYQSLESMKRGGFQPVGASGDGGFMDTILKGAEAYVPAYTEASEKKAKREKDKIDKYVSLRKAGYTPGQLQDYMRTGTVSGTPEGEDYDTAKKKADLKLTEAKTKYYQSGKTKFTTAGKKNEVSGKIFNKEELDEDEYNFALDNGMSVPEMSIPASKRRSKESKTKIDKSAGRSWMGKIYDRVSGKAEEKNVEIKKKASGYTDEQEQMIKENMGHYKKSRAEVIRALKNKGRLK